MLFRSPGPAKTEMRPERVGAFTSVDSVVGICSELAARSVQRVSRTVKRGESPIPWLPSCEHPNHIKKWLLRKKLQARPLKGRRNQRRNPKRRSASALFERISCRRWRHEMFFCFSTRWVHCCCCDNAALLRLGFRPFTSIFRYFL